MTGIAEMDVGVGAVEEIQTVVWEMLFTLELLHHNFQSSLSYARNQMIVFPHGGMSLELIADAVSSLKGKVDMINDALNGAAGGGRGGGVLG